MFDECIGEEKNDWTFWNKLPKWIECLKEYLADKENLCTDETNEDIRALVSLVEHKNIGETCLQDSEAVKKAI